MASNYKAPGVYIEDVSAVNRVTSGGSGFVGAFIGETQTGPVGEVGWVNSWTEYVNKYALNQASPFTNTSYMGHAVYGFFQNGGTRCAIVRAAKNAVVASVSFGSTPLGGLDASSAGAWANNIKVTITANATTPTNFDLSIKMGATDVETLLNLTNDVTKPRYWAKYVNENSKYVVAVAGEIDELPETAMADGSDGDELVDNDYAGLDTSAIHAFDFVQEADVIGVCTPGVTSVSLAAKVLEYCQGMRGMCAVFDCNETATEQDALAFSAGLDSTLGAVYYPWGKIVDPNSPIGNTMNCPTVGHVLGNISNFFANVGPWRSPAGTTAVMRGFVDTVTPLTEKVIGNLNDAHVNCIVPKANYGIVIWGARTLTKEEQVPGVIFYVSDMLLDLYIKQTIYYQTLPFVFQLNNELTWTQIATIAASFLNSVWSAGGLKGSQATDAYFVLCDDSTNTPETIANGEIICMVGYAGINPAEFIIFKLAHTVQSV